MKKLIIRIVAGVVLLVIIALVVVFFSLNSIVKKGVETVGPKLTQVEMRLNSANLSPFSGRGQLSGLFVGNPQGYKTPSAITVGDIKVGVQPSSVMSDTVVIEEVTVKAPEITFEGSLSGNNLSQILANLDAATGGDKAAKPAEPAKKSEKKFYVKDVAINDGKIHLSVTALGTSKAVTLPLPPVHLQNIGSREQGVSAAELSRQIMKEITANATKAVGEAMAKGLDQGVKEIGKEATGQLDKAAKGALKDLFKK